MIVKGHTVCKRASEHMVRVTVDSTKEKMHTFLLSPTALCGDTETLCFTVFLLVLGQKKVITNVRCINFYLFIYFFVSPQICLERQSCIHHLMVFKKSESHY